MKKKEPKSPTLVEKSSSDDDGDKEPGFLLIFSRFFEFFRIIAKNQKAANFVAKKSKKTKKKSSKISKSSKSSKKHKKIPDIIEISDEESLENSTDGLFCHFFILFMNILKIIHQRII